MLSTDTKFFTNEEGKNLLGRFTDSLPKWTQFFDVLVGYFRSSGFLKLHKALTWTEKMRILVGLNVDQRSFDLIQRSSNQTKTLYGQEIQQELETSEDTKEVEEWIEKFIEYIQQWKLEIKVYPHAPIHAKVYIMRKNQETHEDLGKVITWSSNFSQNWLIDQLEFNVELKDSNDVRYALTKFEELWKEWVDVTQDYVDTIKTKTWLNQDILPYHLYLKFLYEYFAETINEDKNTFDYNTPDRFEELQYQKDAVKDALAKLNKYNWVFLADVVGLGKTFVSALLAQQLHGGILVICPPPLVEYWEETFRKFDVACKIESLWKLDHIIKRWHDQFKYVFIDEAHRFRNDETWGYEKLRTICFQKKVILVSATPFNNTFKDLLALISLFQIPRNSTIPNIKNLKWFIDNLDREVKSVDKKQDFDEYMEVLQRNSKIIRERVLKHLMIRRTRQEIQKYYTDDMKRFAFPRVADPVKMLYKFDETRNVLFEKTLEAIKNMSYARYTPSLYMYDDVQQVQIVWQMNLRGFMKTLMVKRLESSFFAFRQTLDRMLASYTKFIEMYDKWDVYVSKKVDIYDLYDDPDKINELIDLVDTWDVIHYKKINLRTDDEKNFEKDLYADFELLKNISEMWQQTATESSSDPKLQKLLSLLQQKDIQGNKVILFSESKETIQYLEQELAMIYPDKVYGFSSSADHGDKDIIRQNFDPQHNNPRNDIQILLTTDVLAEWVNLHRSNIIINYDIPRNPTRVLQRIGRINRVGTKHDNIYVYNFFPTEQSNNEIQLEENVKSKMSAFISLLWSDAKHLTEDEEVQVHTLFDKINSASYLNGEEGEDVETSEVKYLKIIRDIRDNDSKLFEKIKTLPKKSRSSKKHSDYQESLLTFFRKGDIVRMFLTTTATSQELDFAQTVCMMECDPSTPKSQLSKNIYYDLLEQNKWTYQASVQDDTTIDIKVSKGRSNEKALIRTIKFFLTQDWLIDQEEQLFHNTLRALQEWRLAKKSIKELKKSLDAILTSEIVNPTKAYNIITQRIDPVLLSFKGSWQETTEAKTHIILNMYFV